jgi:hypothetical protein
MKLACSTVDSGLQALQRYRRRHIANYVPCAADSDGGRL